MSRVNRLPVRKRRGNAVPALGAAGLMALASGASAEAPVDTSTPSAGVSRQVILGEEEISDVSLATFYVFDKENAGSLINSPEAAVVAAGVVTAAAVVAVEDVEDVEVSAAAVAEVAESASAWEVVAGVAAQAAAWAGGASTASGAL